MSNHWTRLAPIVLGASALLPLTHASPAHADADDDARAAADAERAAAELKRTAAVARAVALRNAAKATPRIIRGTEDWVTVSLAAPPLTRVRCSFDRTDGAHEEVDWDSTQPGALTKTLQLRGFYVGPTGRWNMACGAEQLTVTGNGDPRILALVPAHAGSVALQFQPDAGTFAGQYSDLVSGTPLSQGDKLAVKVTVKRLVDETSLLTRLRLAPGAIPPSAAGRSLDPLPAAATELLKVLAEIAVERAQSQATAFLTVQLRQWLCDDLAWNRELAAALGIKYVPATPTTPATPSGLLLPRTCEAVKHLRIQEISASAEALYRDFVSDLTELGMSIVINHEPANVKPGDELLFEMIRPAMRSLARMTVDVAMGHAPSSEREAQLVLAELADTDWKPSACADPSSSACKWSCGVELAVTLIDECHRVGRCGIDEVKESIAQSVPQAQAGGSTPCGSALRDLQTDWPDLPHLVLRGYDVLRPPQGTTPKQVVRNTFNLVFDLLEQRACPPAKALADKSPSCGIVRDTRSLANAALDQNLQAVLVAGTALLDHALEPLLLISPCAASIDTQCAPIAAINSCALDTDSITPPDAKTKCEKALAPSNCTNEGRKLHVAACDARLDGQHKAIRKVGAVVGAIAAYAATYSTDPKGDPEKIKAQHEERKKAISSMIDATTDRTDRGRDVVVSLGVMPGFAAGYEHFFAPQGRTIALPAPLSSPLVLPVTLDRLRPPSLTLPLGLAVQWLPQAPKKKVRNGHEESIFGDYWGLHLQASPIDLGQFLALDPSGKINQPRPDTLFAVSVQAGALIGTSSNPITLGVDIRYVPTMYANNIPASQGVFRAGLFAGFYVPFFDFN